MNGMRMTSLVELDRRFAPLRLCSPKTEAWLRESIGEEGLRESLVASSGVEAGKLVLVDGFKRWRVLSGLGWSEASVRVVGLDEAGCHAAMLALNRVRRGLVDIEEGWLVQSLCRRCGLKQVEVGELLGKHKSWVCRRLKLVEQLVEPVQEEIRLGLLAAATAREVVRLPRGNQVEATTVVREHGLSSRQAAKLVTAVLAAPPDALRDILADPLRYVCREEERDERGPPDDPRLSQAGNRIRRRLFWLERDAHAVAGVCDGWAVERLVGDDVKVLLPLLRRTAQEAERALCRIRQVIRENEGEEDGQEGRGGEAAVRSPDAEGPR